MANIKTGKSFTIHQSNIVHVSLCHTVGVSYLLVVWPHACDSFVIGDPARS